MRCFDCGEQAHRCARCANPFTSSGGSPSCVNAPVTVESLRERAAALRAEDPMVDPTTNREDGER